MMIFPTMLFREIWADEDMLAILIENNLATIDQNYKEILTNSGIDFFINNSHLTREQLKETIKSMRKSNGN